MLVSVKATALPAAIKDFGPAAGPAPQVVPVLNGPGHLSLLARGAALGAATPLLDLATVHLRVSNASLARS